MKRLFVFAGLPGVGKSTLARLLAREVGAVYLRIDTIEDALAAPDTPFEGPQGYLVAYRLAADNLALGHGVVADAVNPVAAARTAWRALASESNAALAEIEVVCSDTDEHRRRIESRRDRALQWPHVLGRRYEPWDGPRIVVDTVGRSVEESYAALKGLLKLE